MANEINVIFHSATGRSSTYDGMPTANMSDDDNVFETISNPTTSAQTTSSSPHADGQGFVTIQNQNSIDAVAKAGTNPTATATSGWRVPAGAERTYAIKKGHKVAVINRT